MELWKHCWVGYQDPQLLSCDASFSSCQIQSSRSVSLTGSTGIAGKLDRNDWDPLSQGFWQWAQRPTFSPPPRRLACVSRFAHRHRRLPSLASELTLFLHYRVFPHPHLSTHLAPPGALGTCPPGLCEVSPLPPTQAILWGWVSACLSLGCPFMTCPHLCPAKCYPSWIHVWAQTPPPAWSLS